MRTSHVVPGFAAAAALLLAACGGGAAPAASAPAAASSAAAKPSVAASAVASAKPVASAAASASAKPAASPKPTATTLPVVATDTTQVALTKIAIPPIAGKTLSADIMEVDQATHRLYVTDRTSGGIDVFDTSASPAKYMTTVKTKGDPNGVVVAANVKKLLVGEGNNANPAGSPGQSTIGIIDITDPASPKVLAELDAGGKKRADEVDYDPNTKKGLVANSDDQFVTIVDMDKNTIVKKIDLPGGGLEQPRYNPVDKMMYLTGSEDNVLYQFDLSKDAMVKKTEIVDPCNPNGIAINPTLNIAVLGCSNTKQQHLAIWDFKTSKVTSTIDKAGACDGDIYDAKANKFFVACSNFFRGGQLSIVNGDGSFFTNVPTAVGSHGVGYDEGTNTVFTQDQLPNEGVLFAFTVPATAGGGAAAKPAASGAASAKPATSGAASAKPSA
ncbi:MAG TPA: hypothetical protein VK457_24335 [Chloroflexota bacterium]|nr:hypothetical protein [Chloroflexota bacterium]